MILVNDRDEVRFHEGITVREVLDAMGYDWALLTVTVNETFVPPEEYRAYVVPDNADFKAMHLFHGG